MPTKHKHAKRRKSGITPNKNIGKVAKKAKAIRKPRESWQAAMKRAAKIVL